MVSKILLRIKSVRFLEDSQEQLISISSLTRRKTRSIIRYEMVRRRLNYLSTIKMMIWVVLSRFNSKTPKN